MIEELKPEPVPNAEIKKLLSDLFVYCMESEDKGCWSIILPYIGKYGRNQLFG